MKYSYTQEAIADAAGTGQILTVIYDGGKAPGYKRRILVTSFDNDDMQVRELPSHAPKTYLISRTTIVEEDYPAPWMPDNAGELFAVIPEEYFSHWFYSIPPHFYSALGVNIRYVIDQEKTKPAREEAVSNGMPSKEATKHIKVMRSEHALNTPPTFDFHEGDIFYKSGASDRDWIQVIKIFSTNAIQTLEIHIPQGCGRAAYHLHPEELAVTLKTGKRPNDDKKITRGQSKSETLRYMINE